MQKVYKDINAKRYVIPIPESLKEFTDLFSSIYSDERVLSTMKKMRAKAVLTKQEKKDFYYGILEVQKMLEKKLGELSNEIYELNELENFFVDAEPHLGMAIKNSIII